MTGLLVGALYNLLRLPNFTLHSSPGPDWETLLKYRVVVVSCIDAGLLQNARLTNAELMRLEGCVRKALHPGESLEIRPHWSHLLVDEVSRDAFTTVYAC
jgi:hypothetical protein